MVETGTRIQRGSRASANAQTCVWWHRLPVWSRVVSLNHSEAFEFQQSSSVLAEQRRFVPLGFWLTFPWIPSRYSHLNLHLSFLWGLLWLVLVDKSAAPPIRVIATSLFSQRLTWLKRMQKKGKNAVLHGRHLYSVWKENIAKAYDWEEQTTSPGTHSAPALRCPCRDTFHFPWTRKFSFFSL